MLVPTFQDFMLFFVMYDSELDILFFFLYYWLNKARQNMSYWAQEKVKRSLYLFLLFFFDDKIII